MGTLYFFLENGILFMIRPLAAFDIDLIFSEKHLMVWSAAVRWGLFLGGFTGGFRFFSGALEILRSKRDGWNSSVAGFLASLSILYIHKDRCFFGSIMFYHFSSFVSRRTLALYLLARVAQCAYNSAKHKGRCSHLTPTLTLSTCNANLVDIYSAPVSRVP
jgi:hypothetical protein